MNDDDKIMVEMHHQTILLSTILVLLAKQQTMPDKYFKGYADGIRNHEMTNFSEKLRDAVRKRSGDYFESLAVSSKKGMLGDMLDLLNEFRGK